MAIKIPSKNIYEMNNPKIRDNVIDSVSVEQTVVTPNNEYSVTVLSKDEYISSSSLGQNQENTNAKAYEEYRSNQAGTEDYIRAKIAYSRCFDKKISTFIVKVPLIQKNKYVSELIIGKNKETETNNIGVALYGYQNHYTANSTWNCKRIGTQIGGYTTPTITKNPINYTMVEDNSKNSPTTISLPTEIVAKVEDSGLPNVEVSSEIEINDEGNLSTAKYTIIKENDIEYYKLTLQIMHSFNVETLSGADGSYGTSTNVYLSGERIDYVAESLQITLQGNTIGIDLTDGSITYGSGKKPHSLSGNELMQDSAHSLRTETIKNIEIALGGELRGAVGRSFLEMFSPYKFNIGDKIEYYNEIAEVTDIVDDYYEIAVETNGNFYNKQQTTIFVSKENIIKTLTTKHLANNILEQYAKGKETATLLCDIADYYDYTTNQKLISIDKIDTFINSKSSNQTIKKENGRYIVPENLDIAWYNNIASAYLSAGKYKFKVYSLSEQYYGRLQFGRFLTYNDNDHIVGLGLNQEIELELKESGIVYVHFCSDEIYTEIGSRPSFSFNFEVIGATNKMSFRLHDEVIPYVFGANGQDQPMSRYQDGSPKVFEVIGSNMIYDGAIWQELTLQEKMQNA